MIAAQKGSIYLTRPELVNGSGEVIARLDDLEATGLQLLRGAEQVFTLRGRNLVGRITRLPDGTFDVEDYFPARRAGAKPVPYDIRIDGCRVQFVDLTTGVPWTQNLTSKEVRVAGLGPDWVAGATAQVEAAGAIRTRVQYTAGEGLTISGSTESLELAGVLSHFLRTPEARTLGAVRTAVCRRLVAGGPFRIVLAKGKRPDITAHVEAQASGVQYGDYASESMGFSGAIGTEGLTGTMDLSDHGTHATFRGEVVWEGSPEAIGELEVYAPNADALPAWATRFIPKDAGFEDASFSGWVSARSANNYHASGVLSTAAARMARDRLDDVSLRIAADSDRTNIDVHHATYEGATLEGALTIGRHDRSIRGAATAESADLSRLARRFGANGLLGQAEASFLLSGSLDQPQMRFETHGRGTFALPHNHVVSLGDFEASGSLSPTGLDLRQASCDTPYGLVAAHGTIFKHGALDLHVIGRGIQLTEYDPDLNGRANFTARIGGIVGDPIAEGRVEASDLAYQSQLIPAVVADLTIDHSHVEVLDLEGARGTASLSGRGGLDLQTNTLHGTLAVNDIQLAEWLPDEVQGTVDIPRVEISGTISHPLASGEVQGDGILARGIEFDKLSGGLSLDGNMLAVRNLHAQVAGGTLLGSADYDVDERSGQTALSLAGVELKRLPVGGLIPGLDPGIAVTGAATVTANVSVARGNVLSASVGGALSDVVLDQTALGDGAFSVGMRNRVLTGSLNLKKGTQALTLKRMSFDQDGQRWGGDVQASDFPLDEVVRRALPYFNSLPPQGRADLVALNGSLSLTGHIESADQNPTITVSSLRVGHIRSNGQALGDISAQLGLANHRWDIANFTLAGGPAAISFHGSIDEQGETHIDATSDNTIDLSRLSNFDPSLAGLTGTAHIKLAADGPTDSPRVIASLFAEDLFAPAGSSVQIDDKHRFLSISLDNIVIDPRSKSASGITLKGSYSWSGFAGTIQGLVPFEYPFKVPDISPIQARITVDNQNLGALTTNWPIVDAKRTTGSLTGSVVIEGPPDNLVATGAARLTATTVALVHRDDVLKNVEATLTLAPGSLNFRVTAKPSAGGDVSVEGSAPLTDLGGLVRQLRGGHVNDLLDRPFSGRVVLSGARFREQIYAQSTLAGAVTSNLQIGGTARHPSIRGDLSLAAGDAVLNGLPSASTHRASPPINPTFDVSLTAEKPARLRSSTADIYLAGKGSLTGSLEDPKLNLNFTVDKGSVRLPAAVLRLDEGGTVDVDYGVRTPTSASAVVDLEGHTSVTAARFGDTDIERYDITIDMKGDLLQPNGLNLVASSEPPDLNQDRILAILGETDYLETLSTEGKQNSVVQAALLSAVPTLLDPWTSQLAQGLGFDYVTLDYNALEMASVTFGKTLGAGLSFEGSRQISEPLPGYASGYDFRLVYRPRQLGGKLQRVGFYAGADQLNPWKFGLEYSVRF